MTEDAVRNYITTSAYRSLPPSALFRLLAPQSLGQSTFAQLYSTPTHWGSSDSTAPGLAKLTCWLCFSASRAWRWGITGAVDHRGVCIPCFVMCPISKGWIAAAFAGRWPWFIHWVSAIHHYYMQRFLRIYLFELYFKALVGRWLSDPCKDGFSACILANRALPREVEFNTK